MFGKFKRTTDFPVAGSRGPQGRRLTMSDFGFEQDLEPLKPQVLATYDQLGQTMVGTPLLNAMTGPDAAALATELCDRIYLACNEEGATAVRHVVLDMQNVQYMDSMCVGVLVELLTRLKDAGGNIALVNASGNIEYLFKLTRLDRVFPICRDVMKAIEVVEREG
jgi:anti-sigma B factor antagonist